MPKAVKTTPWNKIKAEYLQGVTPKELAVKYNLTAKSITNKASADKWVNDKKIISENLRQNTQDKIQKYTDEIIDNFFMIAMNNDEKTCDRINAGKVILELSGLKNIKPEEKSELPVIQINGIKI